MNVYGETPLHAAAKGKLGNVAKILLNQGADPNIQVFNKTSKQVWNVIKNYYNNQPLVTKYSKSFLFILDLRE